MAKRLSAKRANRPNPRVDKNFPLPRKPSGADEDFADLAEADNVLDFSAFEAQAANGARARRAGRRLPLQRAQAAAPSKVNLVPRNLSQERYLDALHNEAYSIVFAMGPAGTGKTMLATQFAIKGLMEGRFKKIVITRPLVSVDEQIGFLPGTLLEKLAPWCVPIFDVIKEVFPVSVVEKMLRDEVIEIAPLGFMRGRSLKDALVLFDEAQNATPNQMKMVLTRIGENSRMIVTGDLRQHDRGYEVNGLNDFVERLRRRGSQAISVCEFQASDVERHPIIEDILAIYGD